MSWNYGDAGDRYPVRPGEVWEVGPHLLACLDVSDPRAEALVSRVDVAMSYTDPPYDAAAHGAFLTKAGLPRTEYDAFLAGLVRILQLVGGDSYVECGQRSLDKLVSTV